MTFKSTRIAFKVKSQGEMSQNVIISRGTITDIPINLCQFLIGSFSVMIQTDRHTHTHPHIHT